MNHFPFVETPVEFLSRLSTELGVNIHVKRDDVFQIAGGGNKARKLQYILYKAKSKHYNAIVTTGDINSNHNRATAIMAARLGMRVKLIIHNDYPENEVFSKNMFMARICGAEIIYCSKNDVAKIMDKAMDKFIEEGYKPFYIWGGGHCLEGSYAYFAAAKNLKDQFNSPIDKVFFASGTGTTHAGLHVGMKTYFPDTEVCGISIAREKARGISEIYKSVVELENYLKFEFKSDINSISFNDSYLANGYESSSEEITKLISKIASSEGLLLDPTYSGKAFWGMIDQIQKGMIPKNGNVLFWHTGGLFNLISIK
jgi:D-cysteine desulfhydrase